jgi:hypothetical protein
MALQKPGGGEEGRNVAQAVPEGERHRALQGLGRQHHVGVGEEKPITGGVARAFGQGVGLAQPTLGHRVEVHHPQPPILGGEEVEQACRAVGGAVVQGHHIEGGVVEAEQRPQGGLQGPLLVARGDDQAHPRPAAGRLLGGDRRQEGKPVSERRDPQPRLDPEEGGPGGGHGHSDEPALARDQDVSGAA